MVVTLVLIFSIIGLVYCVKYVRNRSGKRYCTAGELGGASLCVCVQCQGLESAKVRGKNEDFNVCLLQHKNSQRLPLHYLHFLAIYLVKCSSFLVGVCGLAIGNQPP